VGVLDMRAQRPQPFWHAAAHVVSAFPGFSAASRRIARRRRAEEGKHTVRWLWAAERKPILILHLLAIVGFTFLVVDGAIFAGVKATIPWPWLTYLLGCYQCSGFWSGLVVGLCIDLPAALLYAAAGSFLSVVAAALLRRLGTWPN
jgi:hypothetical protein